MACPRPSVDTFGLDDRMGVSRHSRPSNTIPFKYLKRIRDKNSDFLTNIHVIINNETNSFNF